MTGRVRPDTVNLALTVYSPEPGTDSEDRLRLLASWAATRTGVPRGTDGAASAGAAR